MEHRPNPVPGNTEENISPEDSRADENGSGIPPEDLPGVDSVVSLFMPREGYRVTPVLLAINLLVFIGMALSGVSIMDPTVDDLIRWGGNLDGSISIGEPWRLLTACFVHIGLMHLLFNMYALLSIGLLLEHLIGSKRFLLAYLASGICSSLASNMFNENMVSAGASGAIFGMYGILFAVLLGRKLPGRQTNRNLLISIGIFIVYNLLYGLKGDVDNAAHIGGLLSGLVIGFFYVITFTQRTWAFIFQWIAPVILVVGMWFSTARTVEKRSTGFDEQAIMEMGEHVMLRLRQIQEWAAFSPDYPFLPVDKQAREIENYVYSLDSCVVLLDAFLGIIGGTETENNFRWRRDYFDLAKEYHRLRINLLYEEDMDETEQKMEVIQRKMTETAIKNVAN